MWFFLLLIIFFSCLSTLINFSLMPTRIHLLITAIIFAILYKLSALSASINIVSFTKTVNDYNMLTFACTAMILESILMLLFTVNFISGKQEKKHEKAFSALSLSPSFIAMSGLFLAQTGIFYLNNTISLPTISFLTASGGAAIFFIIPLIIKKVIKKTEAIAELKLNMLFLSILTAMFLPIILQGSRVSGSQFANDPVSTVSVWLVLAAVAFSGFLYKKFYLKKIRSYK